MRAPGRGLAEIWGEWSGEGVGAPPFPSLALCTSSPWLFLSYILLQYTDNLVSKLFSLVFEPLY